MSGSGSGCTRLTGIGSRIELSSAEAGEPAQVFGPIAAARGGLNEIVCRFAIAVARHRTKMSGERTHCRKSHAIDQREIRTRRSRDFQMHMRQHQRGAAERKEAAVRIDLFGAEDASPD